MQKTILEVWGLVFGIMILIIPPASSYSQELSKKSVTAIRINKPPSIDAELDDEAWQEVPVADDFIQLSPYNGNWASYQSEVKFVYDDVAIYVGAMLYDPHPDSILTELSERDDIGMSDYFGVYFDCFNDYLTAFGFFVTSQGVQIDLKSTESYGEDESWDAVWKSEVKIIDNGWVVELKIPYSAIRFPKEEKQQWGLQVFRNIMRYRENTTWNFVNREVDGLNNQAGLLNGIENIDPPLRLSLVPYVSGYVEKSPETKSWGYSYNYGADIKYGINESWTLDMTLIPDFGQVQSDDEVYNLSPFEVYYDEKRPFFMEGTELFDKGDVFYSRRVGKTPSGYYEVEDSLQPQEKITENPQESQLINATKITGKNNKKLAMGFFNGITANTWATATDTITGNTRRLLTEPFTNYNMIVFDQALKNNSYLSFYNTNVYQPDYKRSANVSGTEFKLANKENKYAIRGNATISQKYDINSHPEFGYSYGFSVGKISGNFTYEFEHDLMDDLYNPNDMGFLHHNNRISDEVSFEYNIYKPTWIILDWFNSLWMEYEQLYNPRTFTEFDLGFHSRSTFKNHLTVWFNTNFTPTNSFDYFEPRNDGWYYIRPPMMNFSIGFSPDYRKKFVVDGNVGYWRSKRYDQYSYWFSIEPRFRVNDKLMIVYEFSYDHEHNDIGYVTDSINSTDEPSIIFGKRNIDNFENILEANYRFSNKSSLAFRLRHYFITLEYNDYFDLTQDGMLEPSEYNVDQDFNYNIFNIDMIYTWNFAPGSEINIVWKNAINSFEGAEEFISPSEELERDYIENLKNTIQTPATNSFSIKVLYYLDYQYLKRKSRKK